MDENLTMTDETVDTAEVDTTEVTDTEGSSGENDGEPAEPQSVEEQAQQPVDVNAIAAAARRKAEGQMHARDAEFARRFGHLTNPKTGQPIRSEQDYLAALDAQEEMRAKQELQNNGVDPSLIDNLIANNPIMRQAQEVIAQNQQAQLVNQINSDIAELSAMDPSITSLETVPPDVIQMSMQRNMSLVDCYKILNFGRISSSQQAAITQQAINQAKGKAHLNPVNGVATPDDGAEIPASQLEMWKDAFPGKTAAELKKLFNKTL